MLKEIRFYVLARISKLCQSVIDEDECEDVSWFRDDMLGKTIDTSIG